MLVFILAPLLLFHTRTSRFPLHGKRLRSDIHDDHTPDVCAETTLYIPGTDEQPISVQQLGTDSNGRTTWVILPGTPTGTFTDPSVQFTGEKMKDTR